MDPASNIHTCPHDRSGGRAAKWILPTGGCAVTNDRRLLDWGYGYIYSGSHVLGGIRIDWRCIGILPCPKELLEVFFMDASG